MKILGRTTLLFLGIACLAACHPDGGRNRAATGSLIGGTLGASVGGPLATGVGAAAGANIGAALDRQQRELQQGLSGSGATVVNTGNQLIVTLPEAITFDVGSTIIHADYVDEIAFIARSLRDNPGTGVQVIGHTDNTGSTEYNQRLSERRAAAVAQILMENGVAANRIRTAGVGYAHPIASNDTPGGRAQNCRVEIVITPNPAG